MKLLRKIAASIGVAFVVFTPLLFASPAYAQSLEEAQSALAAGQQEVVDATQNKQSADDAVTATQAVLTTATQETAAAQAEYDASAVTTTTTSSQIVAECYNRLGYNNAPPLPTASESPISVQNVQNIDFQWGGGVVLNCGRTEDVLVKFTGNLMFPVDGDYRFLAPADDGTNFNLTGMQVITDWYDKGGGGTISETYALRAGILYPFTFYFYENGGGASVRLQWLKPDGEWEVIPASAFGSSVTTTTYGEGLWDALQAKQSAHAVAKAAYESSLVVQTEALARLAAAVAAIPALEQAVTDLTPPPVPPVDPTPVTPPVDPVVPDPDPVDPVIPPVEPEPPVDPTPIDPDLGPDEEPTQPEETLPEVPEPLEPEPETNIPEPEMPVETPVETLEPPIEEPTEEPTEVMGELMETPAEELTEAQVEQLVAAAMETFETAEQGSEEYSQALEALAVAAEADDPEISEELAAIPLLGDAAMAVLDAFNDLGNVGADMSPQVREDAEKTIIAAVIAAQAAIGAVSTATSAASAAAASSVRRNS